jgi:Fe-S oxidoreductase
VGRRCCGRPAFSQGNLTEVKRLAEHNVALLNQDTDNAPILFLEPSCYSMFIDDYSELNLAGSANVTSRCYLFEEFMEYVLNADPTALKFNSKAERLVMHIHCHIKSLKDYSFMQRLGERLPERNVSILDSGCCGMAGAFGTLKSKYELSLKVAEPLLQEIKAQPFGTVFVTSGTSCRHQVLHLTPIKTKHIAEVLAEAMEE